MGARAAASLLLLLALWWPGATEAQAQPVHLESAQLAITEGGTFGAAGPLPRFDDTAFRSVALPHALPRQLVPQGSTDAIDTAWFRLEVPATGTGQPGERLRLYLPRWQTIGQVAVYADGRLLYRSTASPVWNGFNHPLWLVLQDPTDRAQRRPAQVWVRIDHARSAGLALSTAWIGDESGLAVRRGWREWLQADLPRLASAAFLVIGLFALGVWAVRREAVYGLFALASLLFYARALHYYLGLEPLPIDEAWFGWITLTSLFGLLAVVHLFSFRLNARRYPRLEVTLIGLIVLAGLAMLPPLAVLPSIGQLAPLAYLVLTVASLGLTALSLWAAWRSGTRDGLLVAVCNAQNIPAGVHDWMLQNYKVDIEHVYVLPYTAIGLFGVFLFVVWRRYVNALHETEQANARLESRLREREAELRESHARLQAIERERVLVQERGRLMQDMHDGLGSTLMGALKAVEHGYQQDLAQLLRECIDDLKLAIDSLEPVQADLLLLLATLRFRLGTRLEQAGITLQWNVQDVPPLPWLDAASALHILRILQEALSNAVKHSQASRVAIATRTDGSTVVVSVTDNGIGFAGAASGGPGRGLKHVHRRAEAIGASVGWTAAMPGTCFELALPLERAAGAAHPQLRPDGAAPLATLG